ncbi:MAG: DICT sensory domain-containing protein [Thainema sp.]
MRISTSVLEALLQRRPELRPQMYFKSSLTALSHAMEDQVLASTSEQPLIIASFQRERFYRQEAHRYERIASVTNQVYVLAAPETEFTNRSDEYETIAFEPEDMLSQEWHLVVVGQQYTACLICREHYGGQDSSPELETSKSSPLAMDQVRRFDGVWTSDPATSYDAADILLARIQTYRPELKDKIAIARQLYLTSEPQLRDVDPDPFAQRLVTYLQAGQYKLLKAYRSIAAQEQRERLINSITAAIRRSLDPDEIFRIAVTEMGQALDVCRCILYRHKAGTTDTQIQHEHLGRDVLSLKEQVWPLEENPLFQYVMNHHESLSISDTAQSQADLDVDLTAVQDLIEQWQIRSWLIVPILYKGRVLGAIELHHCRPAPYSWTKDEVTLVNAIATQLGVALIQAESYANLEDLNQQLEALDRTRSNLIAITGHELRTPLSTIQVCLESLATEPDMSPELQQVMLNSALSDAERMRKLVQDFLTLSQLESGRIEWHLEPLSVQECIDLALSSVRARTSRDEIPKLEVDVPNKLPLIRADGEWLVEVLTKLLDNACKFTSSDGVIRIKAEPNGGKMLEITVADTGRGIEPQRLEFVFDRFYQEEGALRRSAGGTGLGLAICRQIVTGLGGEIWAESPGRDQGSQFHFTVPTVEPNPTKSTSKSSRSSKSSKKTSSRK